MSNPLRDVNIEKKPLKGFYRARVEDNDDPLRLGRVRVRVFPFFFGDIHASNLPWALPCWWAPMQIPPVGSWVWVFFEEADPLKPVYIGQALPVGVGKQLKTTPKAIGPQAQVQHMHPRTWFEETNSSYPNAYLLRSPTGDLIKMDYSTGEISIHSHTGSKLVMSSDGSVFIYSNSGSQLRLESDGSVVLHAAGDLHLKAAGNIYLDDPESPPRSKKWNE